MRLKRTFGDLTCQGKCSSLLPLAAVAIMTMVGATLPSFAQENPPLSSNERAALGPFPGDVSLYEKELAAAKKFSSPGYYPGLGSAEIADSRRSGVFPAASFTGSFDGPNQVFAWRSQDDYQGLTYLVNRQPGELYLVGGDYPPLDPPTPPGPFLAKADATTGKEIWRTYLDNANISGRWIGNANLNIMDNGKIPVAWSNNIAVLDGDTGRVLKHNFLPSGEAPVADVNFKHLTIAPDRTLILKCQTRPTGLKQQGTMAIFKGLAAGLKQPNSVLVAVHPDTLEVLSALQLPEPSSSPHIIDDLDGKIAVYVPLNSGLMRCFWDPVSKKLRRDETWTVQPMQKGQSTSTAPTIIGDWVAIQTNGGGSDVRASSIVVAHKHDAKKTRAIFPFGELKPGEWSFAPPKAGSDPENHMLYSADMGVGKVAGIKIDPTTGELKLAFVVDDATTTFQPVIGPKDRRVLLLTNTKKNNPAQSQKEATFSGNYTEQLTWRDAATGRLLAASDFFEPLTINSLTSPGYGGRVYFPTNKGFIVFQVRPSAKP